MRTFKYIIIDDIYPHVFTEASGHDEYRNRNVTSAGMGKLHIQDGKLQVETFGKSVSLGIGPTGRDKDILRRLFVDPFWDD